MVGIVNKEFAH